MSEIRKYLLIIVLITLFVPGCSEQQLVQDRLYDESPKEIILSPTGETRSFVLTFNSDWKIKSAPEWLSCSKTKGKNGTNVISVTADVNDSRNKRETTLVFTADDGTSFSIPVYQDFPYINMSIDEGHLEDNKLIFEWNDSEKNEQFKPYIIIIESNVDWKFEFNDSPDSTKFFLEKSSGKGDARIPLNANSDNLGSIPYEAVLSLVALMPDSNRIGKGVDTPTITLHQKNFRFLLNGQCADITVTIDELNEIIQNGTITVNCEHPWHLDGLSEWVWMSANKHDAGVDVDTVYVKANGVNPARERRDKTLILRSDYEPLATRKIQVIQDPFHFKLSTSEVSIANKEHSKGSITLETSGPWEITNIPDWLTVSPDKGSSKETVLISLECEEQNLDLTDKNVHLRFSSTLNGLIENVKVSQDEFIFAVSQKDTLFLPPVNIDKKYQVQITSSGDWSLSSECDWVDLSAQSGKEGITKVDMFAKSPNPDILNYRDAKVVLLSETHRAKGLSDEMIPKIQINLRQTKFIFSVSTPFNSIENGKVIIPAYQGEVTLDIKCSDKWKITNYPEWISVTPSSGKEDKMVVLKADTNTNIGRERPVEISVNSIYNNKTEKIALSQEGFVFKVDNIESTRIFPPVGAEEQEFILNCTEKAPWNILYKDENNNDVDWVERIGPNANEFNGPKTISFRIKENPTRNPRQGKIIIQSNIISDLSQTINYYVSQFNFSVEKDQNPSPFGPLDSPEYNIYVECSSDWTVESDANWVIPRVDGNNVSLSFDNNSTKEDRHAKVTVYSNLQHNNYPNLASEFSSDIDFTQKAFIFEVENKDYTFGPLEHRSITIPIKCSAGWIVVNKDSWVTVNNETGNEDGEVELSFNENLESKERNATITVYSKKQRGTPLENDFKGVITIRQKGYTFDVNPLKFENVSNTKQTLNVNINCSSSWEPKPDTEWIKASAVNDKLLQLSIDQNTTKKERTGYVVVTSDRGHKQTISVTQNK